MKILVGLVIGLLVGASIGFAAGYKIGFAAGYKMEDRQTKHAQLVAVWYADYTRCVSMIPRRRWPLANTMQQEIAAKNRAFNLLGAMYDCGSTSGIGGRRLLEIGPFSGFSVSSPYALRSVRSTP
jgi:hypothetical protein